MTRSDIVSNLISILNKKYKYSVLRNSEELPNLLSNDLDIVIEPSQLEDFVNELKETFRILPVINKPFLVSYLIFDVEYNSSVWLDIFQAIVCKGKEYCSLRHTLESLEFNGFCYTPPKSVEAYISFMNKYLHLQKIKEKYRNQLQLAIKNSPREIDSLYRDNFKHGDLDLGKTILSNTNNFSLRRKVNRRLFKSASVFNPLFEFLRMLPNKNLPDNAISILGTDGAGKSTVISALQKMHPKTKTYHLRPGLIKNISQIRKSETEEPVVVTNPHAKEPHNILISIGMFFYYYIDYTLGFWIKAYPQMIKGNLVIFDRYYYDYYADKKRFRSSLPDWWYRFWEIFIPKPKKVFFLDGTAELFLSRKQEVTKKSLEKQIAVFQKLCRQHKNFISLDASQKPDEIVKEILMNLCSKDYN